MNTIRFTQALTGFFLTAQARKLSPRTIADYQNTLNNKFKKYLNGRDPLMTDITPKEIESFLAGQTTISKKTTLNYHTGLSAFWSWALHEHIVAFNILREVKPPKPEIPDIQPYNLMEIKALIAALPRSREYHRLGQMTITNSVPHVERNRALILLLLDTGVRNDELCAVRVHHLDKRNQRIYIMGKGAKERHVPFSARAGQALWRYMATRPNLENNDPLFMLQNGRPFNRFRMLDLLRTIGERAGVQDVTVHRFRHTCAIQYLRNGGDPYTLQKLLGHSTLDMVKRYLAIAQSDIEAVHKRVSPVDNWAL